MPSTDAAVKPTQLSSHTHVYYTYTDAKRMCVSAFLCVYVRACVCVCNEGKLIIRNGRRVFGRPCDSESLYDIISS